MNIQTLSQKLQTFLRFKRFVELTNEREQEKNRRRTEQKEIKRIHSSLQSPV